MKALKVRNSLKDRLIERWLESDFPGGSKRFQLALFTKDFVTYLLLPLMAVLLFKACETGYTSPKKARPTHAKSGSSDSNRVTPQIIRFGDIKIRSRISNSKGGISLRPVGTITRVKLLNKVETYSDSSVHLQIIDNSLGASFYGATLIGTATADQSAQRIAIDFRFLKGRSASSGISISAQALTLEGASGLPAKRKEGFFARAATKGAVMIGSDTGTSNDQSLKTLVAKMIAGGLVDEFRSTAQVAQAQTQVLTLEPSTEFLVELTDNFPSRQ